MVFSAILPWRPAGVRCPSHGLTCRGPARPGGWRAALRGTCHVCNKNYYLNWAAGAQRGSATHAVRHGTCLV
jgi:hypothetical protein